MIEQILLVDDDPNILDGYRRALRKDFRLQTALGGLQALDLIVGKPPFAVIVSDMRMPEMSGVELLGRLKDLAPESVRIMLTGNADQETASEAVNQGHVFRFLTKPCTAESLALSLTAGIEQYRLVRAEKDLLETTLSGSIQVLTDVLALVNPTAFGRSSRVRQLVQQLSTLMNAKDGWQIEIAAMLSQIGCVTVPEATLMKIYKGQQLQADELRMLQAHPQVGCDLISHIPRLEVVAEIIANQEKKFSDRSDDGSSDGSGSNPKVPLGARILKLALDFDKLLEARLSRSEAFVEIQRRGDWYQPSVVEALRKIVAGDERLYDTCFVEVGDLTPEMILAANIVSASGALLVAKGQNVTVSLRVRLENFLKGGGIGKTVKVFIPRLKLEHSDEIPRFQPAELGSRTILTPS
jgi:response regulator RpfG family c-di-GMP phosphodiesterase